MTQSKQQFERVQRAYTRVLDNRNRKLVEYEDDAWEFILNCWHLRDWIKNDIEGVAKATRSKIDAEVNAHPSLLMIGDLANRSKHLQVMSSVSKAEPAQQTQSTATGYVHVTSKDGTQKTGQGDEVVLMLVVDKSGEKVLIRKLATEAMKNWMAIIKRYRI
jgi:hypothetical protein